VHWYPVGLIMGLELQPPPAMSHINLATENSSFNSAMCELSAMFIVNLKLQKFSVYFVPELKRDELQSNISGGLAHILQITALLSFCNPMYLAGMLSTLDLSGFSLIVAVSELQQLNRDFEGKSSKLIPEGCIRFCDYCFFIACKKVQTHQNKAVLFIFLLMSLFAIKQHISTVIHGIVLTPGLNCSLSMLCTYNPDLDKNVLFVCKHIFP